MYCTYIYVNSLKRICEIFVFPKIGEDSLSLIYSLPHYNSLFSFRQFTVCYTVIFRYLYSNTYFATDTFRYGYILPHLQFATLTIRCLQWTFLLHNVLHYKSPNSQNQVHTAVTIFQKSNTKIDKKRSCTKHYTY